jgi:hypothetical protein
MALMGCDEQLDAFAESVNGELTVSPFEGLLTVTLANAGAARAMQRSMEKYLVIRSAFPSSGCWLKLAEILVRCNCRQGSRENRLIGNGLI